MKNIPITITYLLILIALTFIVGESVQLYEYNWDLSEVYLNDPIYLSLTIMWLAVIVWILRDIIKRKKYIPGIVKLLLIITVIFNILDAYEFNYSIIEIAFKAIEPLLWLAAYYISKNKFCTEWFIK